MSKQRQPNWFFAARKRFLQANRGNVAITFAFALVPMVTATLGIIQYGTAIATQTKLNAIADAAALQMVSNTAASAYVSAGTLGKTNATNMFNAQAALVKGVTVNSLTVNVVPTAATSTTPGKLTGSVSYTATITNLVPALFGSVFTTVSGSSQSTSTLPAYANFYLLLDNSPSMGIGATAADMTTIGNVNGGCGFECHSPDALQGGYPGYTNDGVISGATTRLDALQTAAQQVITIAKQSSQDAGISNLYQFGIYTFNNSVKTVSALSSNYTQIASDINAIALPTTDQSTQIADAINWLTQNVVTSGAGNGTKNSPYQFVFLVTDGVEDHYNFDGNYSGGSYETLTSPVGTWNSSPYSSVMLWNPVCPNLKTKGATIAVIYTTYDTVSGTQYTDMVQPFAGNIAGALQNCATTGYFLQADDGPSIQTAVQNLFRQALQQTAHLSQ